MSSRILLMLAAAAVPILLGFACQGLLKRGPARFESATGRFLSYAVAATCGLISAWMLFGIWGVILSPSSSPWVMVVGLAGLMFGSLFGLTVSSLEWHASRPKPPGKVARRLASKGPLWDAELDR
jgi:hypothetical protein